MGCLLASKLVPTPCSFFSLNDEPALVQEEKCRMGRKTIPRCTHGEFLKSVSEARRIREAWWKESGGAFALVTI